MKISARQYWNLLIDYLKPQWPRVLLLAVLLFSNIGLQLINPQILRYFIDTVSGNLTSGRGIVDKISRYFIDATGLGVEKPVDSILQLVGVHIVEHLTRNWTDQHMSIRYTAPLKEIPNAGSGNAFHARFYL